MIYGWRRSPLHSIRRIRWRNFFVDCCTGSDPEARTPCGRTVASTSGGGDSVWQPVPAAATGSAGLETLLSGNLTPVQQPRPGPIRRDWNVVVCFSCGKAGHGATRCPTLDESFPFMLPRWTAEKTMGGYAMISPQIAAERRGKWRLIRWGGGGVRHPDQ